MPGLVAIEGPPGPEFVVALRRCWDAGDAVLPVDHRLPRAEVDRLYAALRPTRVGDRPVEGRPTEPGDALVVATSGTTGEPKGVVLTHAAVAAAAQATSARVGADPASDTWLCCLPVAHVGGLGVITRALVTETPLLVHAGFDAATVAAAAAATAAHGRRVLTSLVATALRRIDPTLFAVILLGGDRPPDDVPTNAVVTYGMTETGGGCVYDGEPLAGVDVRIDDAEVRVRGSVLGRAYRTAAEDVPLVGADGWFATGDAGEWDADGRLVVHGRLAEVIVSGGEKVWPGVVENVLARCAGVAAVAVVGAPDPEWGERVVAVVVPDGMAPITLQELRDEARSALPPWALPRELALVDELPTTSLGKVRRAAASRRQRPASGR